jgi:hypothetical protein
MVRVRGTVDERTTSPQSAATGHDLRAGNRRFSVAVAGGLFVAFLIILTASVVWVSDDSKHPLVQPNPLPPPTSAPMPSPTMAPTAAEPAPLPVPPTQEPPPADTPVDAMPPTQVTAEMITPPPPPPFPWQQRLHELFPQLFPSG